MGGLHDVYTPRGCTGQTFFRAEVEIQPTESVFPEGMNFNAFIQVPIH